MAGSVFEHLGERLRPFEEVFDGDELKIEAILEATGKALFSAISSAQITFQDIPDWMRQEPLGHFIGADSHGEPVEKELPCWASYWCTAVVWLARHMLDSGIVVSRSELWQFRPTGTWFELDMSLPRRMTGECMRAVWQDIASISVDACEYFVRKETSCAVHPERCPPIGDADEEKMRIYTEDGWIDVKSPKIITVVKNLTTKSGAWLPNHACLGESADTTNRVDKLNIPKPIMLHIDSSHNGYRWLDHPEVKPPSDVR